MITDFGYILKVSYSLPDDYYFFANGNEIITGRSAFHKLVFRIYPTEFSKAIETIKRAHISLIENMVEEMKVGKR